MNGMDNVRILVINMTNEEYERWESKEPITPRKQGFCHLCGCSPCESPGACRSQANYEEGEEPRNRRQNEDWY